MPTPNPGDETRDEWMQRCIPVVLEDGTAEDQEQAVAICSSMWEQATKDKETAVHRAYAVLHIKQADEERRIITGLATTPAPDRVGDIIEPMGVNYKNPLPLLLYHDSKRPVGEVKFNKPTKDGITFEARLPKIETPGILKARVDEAWDSVKAGLIKGVSIGFRELEAEPIDAKDPFFGGTRFIETEVLELSLVTIPANAEATIETFKQYDFTAASGPDSKPGVPGKSVRKSTPKRSEKPMKTIAEQISAFEAKRKSLDDERDALMAKSAESGETLDEADAEEYDRHTEEIGAIDKHLDRLKLHEQQQAAKAKEINGHDQKSGSDSRGNGLAPRVSVREPELPPGIRFARIVKCLGMAQGNRHAALQIAEKAYSDDTAVIAALRDGVDRGVIGAEHVKANVGAGSSTGTTWAGPLVGTNTSAFADFVEWLRPQTLIDKFGQGGIPGLRRVPFRVALITQTSGGDGYWVGEGAAKPLTKFDFSRTTMSPLKCANITVLTKEVIRDSNPSAETIIRDQLAAALIQRMDTDFIDPDNSGTANIKPAGITNGANSGAASGTDADSLRRDIAAAVSTWIAANNRPTAGVWIMSAVTAVNLQLMTNALGQPEFTGIGINGGTLFGMPVITTEVAGYTQDSPAEGRLLVLVNASDIYLADEGGIEVDMSEEASLTMDDAPTGSSVTPTTMGSPVVSMFQTNSVAFRAERTINWLRRRTEAVYVITNVNYGV